MNSSDSGPTVEQGTTDQRLRDAVCSALRRFRPDRLLVISALPEGFPELEEGCANLLARVETSHVTGQASLECDAAMLPFGDESFDAVIAHHILADGSEAAFDEIQRVLKGDGQVIIIGRGRFGMRGEPLRDELPYIDARALCRNLRQRTFQVRQCEGFGVLGRPAHLSGPWQGTALPLSDAVMVRGRHQVQRPVVTHLRFSRPQTAGAQSSAYDGVRRQAV